ncbi:MAG TPA: hypothetical protein PLM56_05675 [Cyclobacteriaceae bacterium]|nr:hypothetical protein [Cyclobacteriaceae bacterium]HRF32964.1 hypothetical protein [Cyclobacteriaceae bacterium]
MLESISWQEFFTTIAVLLGAYYAITVLLLFSSEITNLFKPRTSIASGKESQSGQPDSENSHDLMGSVRFDTSREQKLPREEVTTADELDVVQLQEAEEPVDVIDLQDEALTNDLITLQAEIKSLAEIISLGTKEEAVSLFTTLLSNYPQFVGTFFQHQISQLIYDSCKETGTHHFDLQEISAWWNDSEASSDDHQ